MSVRDRREKCDTRHLRNGNDAHYLVGGSCREDQRKRLALQFSIKLAISLDLTLPLALYGTLVLYPDNLPR